MRNLSDIFGQHRAIETIVRAEASGRLPHAMIFAGPVGVGKRTTAEALARYFLCHKPRPGTGEVGATLTPDQFPRACGRCPSCVTFDAGTHPDFHFVYRQLIRIEKKDSKARDLSADVIREYLVAPAQHTAQLNNGKVFVVKEAELMNATAQNSLLKTLEEPPGKCLIVLLTDSPAYLLSTIRSRSQLLLFRALDRETVSRELARRDVGVSDAAHAARYAAGSLGLALRWLEDGVIAQARELEDRLTTLVSGRGGSDLPDWFKKSADAYAAKQLLRDELYSRDQANKEGLLLYLKLAAEFFRGQLVATSEPDDHERACDAIDAILLTETYLDANVTVSVFLQQLVGSLEAKYSRRETGASRALI